MCGDLHLIRLEGCSYGSFRIAACCGVDTVHRAQNYLQCSIWGCDTTNLINAFNRDTRLGRVKTISYAANAQKRLLYSNARWLEIPLFCSW